MFGQPALGAALAFAHYAAGLSVGILYRFYGARQEPYRPESARLKGLFRRALDELYRARIEDGRPMGRIVNEAISESVATLFMIMSFIVLFAVLLRVLEAMNVLPVLAAPLTAAFHLLGWSTALVGPAIKGVFEIDIGAAAVAQSHAPFLQQLMLVSAIIAWSGLSVHGQVASVLTGTDISMKPYFLARLLHAVLAALYTPVFLGPLAHAATGLALPAYAGRDWIVAAPTAVVMLDGLHFALMLAGFSCVALGLGALVAAVVRGARLVWIRVR
jgi:sporulation integral membrane protein YlbJ